MFCGMANVTAISHCDTVLTLRLYLSMRSGPALIPFEQAVPAADAGSNALLDIWREHGGTGPRRGVEARDLG
jgi:hypothetical protein